MPSWSAVSLTTLPTLGGLVGSLMTEKQVWSWYETQLDKPSWTPPTLSVPPIRIAFFLTSGYASFLIHRDAISQPARNLALSLYGTQLGITWIWPLIFFKYHKLGLASLSGVALWGTLAGCIWSFYSINKTASYLMIPYFAWITFHTSLVTALWRRNKNKKFD